MLTDAQWAMLEPLVEQCRPKGKTPPQDLRRTFEAILWRHENGAKWRSVPAELGPPGCLGASAQLGAGAWHPARHDVSRRHQRARASEGGRSAPKRGSQAQRDDREALGRSRGGYGTKACVIADALGCAVAFRPVRRTSCRKRFRCWTAYPAYQCGWSEIAATPAMPSASMSGAWAPDRRSRPNPTKPCSPVRSGSTTPAMWSSGSGRGSRSGGLLQPATRRRPHRSWAYSASRPLSTGSRPNRP